VIDYSKNIYKKYRAAGVRGIVIMRPLDVVAEVEIMNADAGTTRGRASTDDLDWIVQRSRSVDGINDHAADFDDLRIGW
jgi:hypothetical protein